MFDWITHNKGLFLNSYTEIGASHPHAMELQTQHNHFAMNCMVSRYQTLQILAYKRFLANRRQLVAGAPTPHTAVWSLQGDSGRRDGNCHSFHFLSDFG